MAPPDSKLAFTFLFCIAFVPLLVYLRPITGVAWIKRNTYVREPDSISTDEYLLCLNKNYTEIGIEA